jgi:DNA repair photolyase
VKAICQEFAWYKDKILFRFTIGSSDSNTLKFWEPNAPDFAERLESLKYAFSEGYQTSVSCEPMLDDNIGDVIDQVSPFVTDSIWIGKMNQPSTRLSLNGEKDPLTIQKAKQLEQWQSDANIKLLYGQFKDNPRLNGRIVSRRFWESIFRLSRDWIFD